MANLLVASREDDFVIACEYDSATAIRLYDEPVLCWLVDDTSGVATPVIPGTLPPPAATPSIYTPVFANAFLSPQRRTLVIAPDAFRGFFADFLIWMNTTDGASPLRVLTSQLITPELQSAFSQWAQLNPGQSG